MMEPVAVPSPPPAPRAQEVVRAPLPGLMMGDDPLQRPREHGWPGRLFITLSYLGALGLGLSVLGGALMMANIGPPMLGEASVRILLGGAWCVLQWRLATEVKHFSRWGWYGAMVELAGAAALKLFYVAMAPIGAAFYIPVLAANALWIRYFWQRRAHFGVDLGT